jgi:hypothetical protein
MVENVVEQLIATRLQLDRACGLLSTPLPASMDACTSVLQAAAAQLSECQPAWAVQAGNAAALEEAWRLRRSFTRAQRLLQHAAEFHTNWGRIRGAMAGGYTAQGEPAPVEHGSRICLRG